MKRPPSHPATGTSAPELTADWRDIVDLSPVATMVLLAVGRAPKDADDVGCVVYANAASANLFGHSGSDSLHSMSIFDLVGAECHDELSKVLLASEQQWPRQLRIEVLSAPPPDSDLSRGSTRGDVDTMHRVTLHVQPLHEDFLIVQFVECDGWQAVDRVLDEQQLFRSALMELSELAHNTKDDKEFYQRLIERAVEVVPGAQGGSVQLNIPGTASFRFVAALGYDLEGLQRHVLEGEHFFRDAWDPVAQIVRKFENEGRTPEIAEWLETVGRLSEIVVNCSAPVIADGLPVAFLSLDNFEDPDAMNETSVEMTTVLSRLIGDLWRRRELEAALRKERESFRHQALHDPLTGLANRRSLQRSLDDTLSMSRRGRRPSSVLFVDLDDFKGVNDRLGHEVGDLLLTGVAHGLSKVVRTHDFVGRWGGDEFLVVPSRLESVASANELAERILAFFEQDLQLSDEVKFRVRLTVGVGWSADSQIDANALVRAADEALYEAKAAGKGVSRSREALG